MAVPVLCAIGLCPGKIPQPTKTYFFSPLRSFIAVNKPSVSKVAAVAVNGSESGSSTHSHSSHHSHHFDEAISEFSHVPGYSSGASTPVDGRSLDGSFHDIRDRAFSGNPKTLSHSNSVLGLDNMIEARKGEGDLMNNMVHIEVPFGKPVEEVYDGVHTGPVLGSGISGLVRLVTHKATGHKYAVKCLDLGLVDSAEGLQQLREEIFIMCQLDHPNIVRLEGKLTAACYAAREYSPLRLLTSKIVTVLKRSMRVMRRSISYKSCAQEESSLIVLTNSLIIIIQRENVPNL